MKQNNTKSFITILNVLLLFLLAFIGFNTAERVLGASREAVSVEPLTAKENTLVRNTPLTSNSALPDYSVVWERNLFDTSQKALSSPQKQIDLANVTETDKTTGLKLLGTVVVDVSTIESSAIIKYKKYQSIYYEGDTAGTYVIKKILRNNVIVATENGDKLLALKSDYADRGKVVPAFSSQAEPEAYRHVRSGGRFKTVGLPASRNHGCF
jgi:hypothetical protein